MGSCCLQPRMMSCSVKAMGLGAWGIDSFWAGFAAQSSEKGLDLQELVVDIVHYTDQAACFVKNIQLPVGTCSG